MIHTPGQGMAGAADTVESWDAGDRLLVVPLPRWLEQSRVYVGLKPNGNR